MYPPVHSASTGSDANRSVAREPDALVVRRELLQRLKDQPAARLIVVQGPAGFGKTVLLRQYCEHRTAQGDAIAWMRMDARSADPPQFLRLLCAAIQGIGENPPRAQGKATARSASLDDFGRVLRRVRGRAVIVVDGFEHAGAAGLESVFAQVVRLLPEGVQLCIGTRALPPANLARLLVEDQAIAIGQEDLRFRAAETAEFLRDVAVLSPAEVTDIHQRSDGWPAALQCFRLCMRRGRDYRSMAYSGKGITPELIDFLASDVFEDLTPRMQSLLLELCVPEKINAALVEHITGAPGGRAVLTEIEKAGLFLSHSDLDRTWYRFHNLFRHFLLARLRTATSAEEMQGRHLRIAQWFAAQEWREEALQHYIDAGQLEPAAQLLDAVIDGFVAEERLGLIERYVDQFPLETLLRHENLANAAVIAYGFRRSFDKANRLIEQRQLANDAAAADPHRAGIRNYARLYMLAAQDRIEEMGAVALETAAQLTEQDGCRYGVAFNARAMWLVANHQFDEARGLLLRARPLHDQDGHLFGQAYQEAIYSMVLTQQGRVNDAIKGLSAALRRTEQGATGSVTAGSVIAAYLAEACYEQNRIADAEALVHDYGQLAEQQGIADQLAVMLLTQARMAHLRGDETEAEEILERLLYLGYRHSFRRVVTYARAEFVRQATLSGDLDKAERRLREFDPEHDGTVNERLVFHAGETEARSITLARYLIYTGRHANARNLLQVQMREARLQRRRRREVKLTLLLAISLNAEGRTRLARRTFLEALELARPQEFVRAFLDERQLALRLIKDVRQSMHELADLPVAAERDALVAHLDRLLREAGELAPAAAAAPGALRVAPSPEMAASLTEREKKLLQHVARGLSNKDLATRLSVSTNTIKWHLRNIFEKLQISNRVQAIAVARQLGLID